MLRHKPKLTYKGLTVILSNPSRFDNLNLLSAGGGRIFDEALRPDFNRMNCDIRLKDDTSPFLDGTKCVLLLGNEASKQIINSDSSLGAIRGSVYFNSSSSNIPPTIPIIPSFFPQDAADIKNYEKEYNEANVKNRISFNINI